MIVDEVDDFAVLPREPSQRIAQHFFSAPLQWKL
jgi:hypothetical protein